MWGKKLKNPGLAIGVAVGLLTVTILSQANHVEYGNQYGFAAGENLNADKLNNALGALAQALHIQQDRIDTLEQRLATLQPLEDLMANGNLSIVATDNFTGVPHVVFSGVNLQVVSGLGLSESPVNGTGNLIIGYNEGGIDDNSVPFPKTGSHNLVMGNTNGYANYGGIVAGSRNNILNKHGVILTGVNSVVSADDSVIISGYQNNVSRGSSAILGNDYQTIDANSTNPTIPATP